MDKAYEKDKSYIPPPTPQPAPSGASFEGFPRPPLVASTPENSSFPAETTPLTTESKPENPPAATTSTPTSPTQGQAETAATVGEFQESKARAKRARRAASRKACRLAGNLSSMSLSNTVSDTTNDSVTAPDRKRQRREPTEGNQSGGPKKAPTASSGKAAVAKPVPGPEGQQSSPPRTPAASYSLAAAGGKPLTVSFRGSDKPLGEEQAKRVRTLIDSRMSTARNLGFPLQILGVALREHKIRVSCENAKTHAWVKALINDEVEGDFVARSPDETPPQRRFWFRLYQGFDVPSFHHLLRVCNVNFPEGKLHIKRVASDGNGISLTVGAEPLMVKYLEERNFQLFCGSTVIKLKDAKRGGKGRGPTAMQNRASTPKGAQVQTRASKGPLWPAKLDTPTEAAKAEVPGSPNPGTSAQADPIPPLTNSPSLPPPEKAEAGTEPAEAEAGVPPPNPSSSPDAAEAGSVVAASHLEPAKAEEGAPTSPHPTPPPPQGVAGPSSGGLATPLVSPGNLPSPQARKGNQGKNQKGKAGPQAKPGSGKKGKHKSPAFQNWRR